MKKKLSKTNAVRILEKVGIAYELRDYEVDEHDLSAGISGCQMLIGPEDLVKVVEVKRHEIKKESERFGSGELGVSHLFFNFSSFLLVFT